MQSSVIKNVFLAAFCCLFLKSIPSAAQIDPAAAQDHLRAATRAYQEADYEGYTVALEAAAVMNPFSLYTRYNLACGYARTGREAEALTILRELVAQRIDFGMAQDPDLEALHGKPEFARLVSELERGVQPVLAGELRFTLDELGLIPEGIARDSQSGRIFLGSMRTGEIFVIDDAGHLSRFASVSDDGKLAAIGMSIEHDTNTLWVVGSSFFLVENFDDEAPARSGIFGFDLDSGALTRNYLADDTGTTFNDVAVGVTGDLYISGDELSVVRHGSDRIEALATDLPIFGSNGIAVRPDGERIFVSSYPVGIAAVDPATGASYWLEAPDDVSLYGIDGLYWYEGGLVAVQNGARPWRLVRFLLNEEQTAVTDARLIEFANEGLTATTGAIDGNLIHFVGRDPRPESIPAHFPDAMAGFAGKIIVMTAPLD